MTSKVNDIAEARQWSINQLAKETGFDRRTISKRLDEAGAQPAGMRNGHPVYELREFGPALYGQGDDLGCDGDGEYRDPVKRRAWFQSENERLKFEQQMLRLIPAESVHREMSLLAKAMANGLDSLADMLERDAGLKPETIEMVERVTDSLRDQMYQAIIAANDEDADG